MINWTLPPPFDAILFDFDGVLLDSEPVHFACWSEALAPLGMKLDWDDYARLCIGISERATVELFARLQRPPAEPDVIWARYPLKKDLFRRRMAEGPPFVPGLDDFLASLAPAYKLAVVSSSSRSEIEPLLDRAGLRRRFGALVTNEDVTRHKPEPDAYLLAARLLEVKRPLVVEDSDSGMESARRAGFEALRIPAAARTIELVRARL
jgi:beta-phosphoglucomutase